MPRQRTLQTKIHIYSQNNFLSELLKLSHKRCSIQSYTTYICPKFDFINHRNIILIHYNNFFKPIFELSDQLHVVCKFIVIANPAELEKISKHKNIHVLLSPIHCEDLFKLLNLAPLPLLALSPGIILNTELRLLIKIKDKNN